ncbi:APC family permease [Haloferula sp. A504]|uniref:APC family permease n=1 Tax=Haloferula sp. A504 TaxID=3373601 RepID=UPI0031C7116E|nr:APC family permease [Verrucomicrobiaceae bacterium E54]
MGLAAATSIGVGGMIGAGIFSVIGVAARITGSGLPWAFLVGGLIALLSVYSFARLGACYPSAGGPVEFLVRSFGNGVVSGAFNLLLWVGYCFALALYARAFGGYLAGLFGGAGFWKPLGATAIVIAFTAINVAGARTVGRSELVIVGVKVFILLAFVAIGLCFVEPSRLSLDAAGEGNWLSILQAAVFVFIAYEGFGLITNAGDDMREPRRTLPKALYLSVLITLVIYVLIGLTVIGNLAVPEIVEAKDHALARAAEPFLGRAGYVAITVAALFSIASAINATLYGGANVSYMVAHKGHLPAFFERKVWQESKAGLYVTSGVVIVAANLLPLDEIAAVGSALFLVIYGVVNLGHLRIRRKTGGKAWWIVAAILSCLAACVLLLVKSWHESPLVVVIFGLMMGGAFAFEILFRRFGNHPMETMSQEWSEDEKEDENP